MYYILSLDLYSVKKNFIKNLKLLAVKYIVDKIKEKVSLNCYNFVTTQKTITEERNLMKSVTEKKKKNIHFTYEDRLILKYYLNGKSHFPKITNTEKLSEILHKSRRTIQREIKRG